MDVGRNLGSAAKEPTIDLEVAGSGLVSCRFFIPFPFLTMCSSQACLTFVPAWIHQLAENEEWTKPIARI